MVHDNRWLLFMPAYKLAMCIPEFITDNFGGCQIQCQQSHSYSYITLKYLAMCLLYHIQSTYIHTTSLTCDINIFNEIYRYY